MKTRWQIVLTVTLTVNRFNISFFFKRVFCYIILILLKSALESMLDVYFFLSCFVPIHIIIKYKYIRFNTGVYRLYSRISFGHINLLLFNIVFD